MPISADSNPPPLAEDREHVLAHMSPDVWERLRGRRIFITGGTGFFGKWLLQSLIWANDAFDLQVQATVLTRDPEGFAEQYPELAGHPSLAFRRGDVLTPFAAAEGESFDYIIHAATEASAAMNENEPRKMLDTVAKGTENALEFARQAGARRFLLTSSGAVYGRQPPDMPLVDEDYRGAPDTLSPASAYGEGKRYAETLCAIYAKHCGLDAVIARCWAFVGPYLPLDRHFAIGNFIRDGINGGPVQIGGDGTPYRSYLYGADLAIHLWTLLVRGQNCRAYNVGSDEAVTIRALAEIVAECCAELAPASSAPIEVQVARAATPGRPAERYVPSVRRIAEELGLSPTIDLRESVRRTIIFHRQEETNRIVGAAGAK